MVAALTLNIFHRHTKRVKLASAHRPDGQRPPGDDPHRRTEKMLLTPTLPRLRHVPAVQGRDAPHPARDAKGRATALGDEDLPMVDVSAARSADGRLYLALVRASIPICAAQVATSLCRHRLAARSSPARAMDTHNFTF